MAYERYDREERGRWSDDRSDRGWRSEDRSSRNYNQRGQQSRDDDRGFFERAGDEISSWFGGRDHDEGRYRDRGDDRHQRDAWRSRAEYGRSGDEGRGWNRNAWSSGDQGRSPAREQSYRPMAGDYGAGYDREPSRDYERSRSPYARDERSGFAGPRERGDRDFDPHYRSWRDRQVSEFDRDYDEFRREHQAKFESDFAGWREKRQQKRALLGQVREHMEVVGKDEQHVGTIDKIAGDRLILAKSDPDSGGAHHSLSCSDIDRIEGDRVILDCAADEAKNRWRDESRSRALFEREDQGEMGPGILERSFSGTYR